VASSSFVLPPGALEGGATASLRYGCAGSAMTSSTATTHPTSGLMAERDALVAAYALDTPVPLQTARAAVYGDA
jgi:hypothetical protein